MSTIPVPADVKLAPPAQYNRNVRFLRLLGLAITVGLLGAVAVLAFHQILLTLEAAFYEPNQGLVADAAHLPPELRLIVPALGGLVSGLVLEYFLARARNENGADYMEAIVAGNEIPWRSSVLKSAASAATVVSGGSIGREGSIGSGAVGGVFTPTLFVGAALGTLAGSGVQLALPGTSMTAFTLVGMSGLLAAVTHAPLTAVVMVSEMTSGYGLVPALVLSSLAGYYVSSVLHPRSIYAQSIPQNHPTQVTPSTHL